MRNDTYVPYAAMKELIAVLEKHKIPYSFGEYYTEADTPQGHWLTIDAEIYTDELDENDHLYDKEDNDNA